MNDNSGQNVLTEQKNDEPKDNTVLVTVLVVLFLIFMFVFGHFIGSLKNAKDLLASGALFTSSAEVTDVQPVSQ